MNSSCHRHTVKGNLTALLRVALDSQATVQTGTPQEQPSGKGGRRWGCGRLGG